MRHPMADSILIDFMTKFLVALIVGGLIGIERERKSTIIAGVRTFTLTAVFGMLASRFASEISSLILVAAVIFIGAMAAEAYWVKSMKLKTFGITTVMALLITFFLGVAVDRGYLLGSAMVSVIITFLLASKEILQHLVRSLTQVEIMDALKFGIVSIVVLPVLPNRTVDPWGLFNPSLAWLMVVLVLGISFVAYIAMKLLGLHRGIGVTGLLAGMVSSTAVTTMMAERVRKNPKMLEHAVIVIVLASSVMFVRTEIISAIINPQVAMAMLFPMAAAALVGTSESLVKISRFKETMPGAMELGSPFAFSPAIKFAAFFAAVLALSQLATTYFGASGIYMVSVLGGIVNLDAITISMSSLALTGKITVSAAANAIIFGCFVNTLVKWGLSFFFGSRRMALRVGKAFLIIIAVIAVVTGLQIIG